MKSHFWKIILLVTVIFAGIFNLAEAREVTVDGVGSDRESALKDARRVAVGQVVGTFVDSRTLTKNNMLELDEICLKSRGFIGKVDILSEGVSEGMYKVRATIEVQENPSPELLQQVQAVVALNDPRIAVAVLKENSAVHEKGIETAIIDKLTSINFSHITAANSVTNLQNIQQSKNIADFIVFGECRTTSKEIQIPDFKGGYVDTGFYRAATEMIVKIVKIDTGDILETFTVGTSGVEVEDDLAESESLKNMADQAATKVDEKFRRIGSKFDA